MNRFTRTAVLLGLLTTLCIGCGGPPAFNKMTARELYDHGMDKYEHRKFTTSTEAFRTLVYNYAGESLIDTAQYYLALSHFGNKEFDLAGIEFNRLIVSYPTSGFFQQSMFMKAVCFFEGTPKHHALDQSSLARAIRQFEDFLIDFPESDVIPEVKRYLNTAKTRMAHKHYDAGMVYLRLRGYKAAITYFQLVVDDYTDTKYAPLALLAQGKAEYKLREYDKARVKLEGFLALYDGHEKSDEVRKLLLKSAFAWGEKALLEGEIDSAYVRLTAFKTDFPDSDLSGKADKHLKEIDEIRNRAQADAEPKS